MTISSLPNGAIVVGIDGSESSDRALTWAAGEAALDHRPLVLVHAIGGLGTPGTVWLTEGDPMVTKMRAVGEDLLAAASQQLVGRHPSVQVHTRVVTDDARKAILDLANQAWMVVLGSRGRGTVRSLLLGSVSAAVARHATCPVVVVRPHHPGTVRRGVLVGADGTAASLATLEFAYREASVRQLPLTVMHCVDDVLAQMTSAHLVPTDDPALEGARLLLAESVAGMSEKYPDVPVHLELCRGAAAHALSTAADTMNLLVVGRRHAGALSRLVTGDVSGYLVEHARTVVVVVPERSGPTDHPAGTSSPERTRPEAEV